MTPRRPTPGWAQLRRGLAYLALLAVAATAIFLADTAARELSEGPELVVAAAEARDLEPGSRVWVAGVPAGRVLRVRFRDPEARGEQQVLVRAALSPAAASTLRRDATAEIRSPALLAPAVVDIDPGTSPRTGYDFSDTLRATPRPGREEVLALADSVWRRLEAVAPLARRLEARLDEGPGTLASLRADTALRRQLGAGLRRLGEMARRIPGGSAARLAGDTALHRALGRIAGRVPGLTGGLTGAGEGRVSAAEVRAELERLETGLERLADRLDDGRGTAGRLLHDRALEVEWRRLRARMDSVRKELLAEPLRWLRFRLF